MTDGHVETGIPRPPLDLSSLPLHGLGPASLTWWGTMAFILIEGTGFALTIAIYLYLASLAPSWPMEARAPDLTAGTFMTVLLLASLVPNLLISRWAEAGDLRKIRIGLLIMCAFGAAPIVVRVFEFPALHVWWDTNAYGSIVWLLLGLHTTHLLTDVIDTFVLTALMFTRHAASKRRYGDAQDNVLYWNFVVLAWLPIYGCIYWIPRL